MCQHDPNFCLLRSHIVNLKPFFEPNKHRVIVLKYGLLKKKIGIFSRSFKHLILGDMKMGDRMHMFLHQRKHLTLFLITTTER